METYLQFAFKLAAGTAQEILIAALADWPFEGFEEQGMQLIAYIPESACGEDCRNFIQELSKQYGIAEVVETLIPAQNWNADWEKNYEPVVVENFCQVRADFHPSIAGIPYEILITPKMSFGTGHHATTYMMIKAARELDFSQKTVLDYGCGTSVLAILAAKLGAKKIDAIDNDIWAYQNSLENTVLNNCQNLIDVIEGDWSKVPSDTVYDIILANINRNVILASMTDMSEQLIKNGLLFCSGFLQNDVELIVESAAAASLKCIYSDKREQWHCLGFEKI